MMRLKMRHLVTVLRNPEVSVVVEEKYQVLRKKFTVDLIERAKQSTRNKRAIFNSKLYIQANKEGAGQDLVAQLVP